MFMPRVSYSTVWTYLLTLGNVIVEMNFMEHQSDINSAMRTILVDWLIEVADEYKLNDETLFLCIQYIDRFLSTVNVTRSKLQLLGKHFPKCNLIVSKIFLFRHDMHVCCVQIWRNVSTGIGRIFIHYRQYLRNKAHTSYGANSYEGTLLIFPIHPSHIWFRCSTFRFLVRLVTRLYNII